MDTIEDLQYTKLKTLVYLYISSTARTKYEVTQKILRVLSKSDISDDQKQNYVDTIILELEEQNLINDENYCISYINKQFKISNPKSKLEVKKFLFNKGIDSNLIQKNLDLYYTFDKEIQIINKIYTKKSPKNQIQNNKFVTYLRNRGFSYDAILEVLPI